MDVEVASQAGPSRFRRCVAVLVGLAAVAGALLGTLEMASRKGGERAQFLASRISVDLYGRETARQVLADTQSALDATVRAAAVEADTRRDRAAGEPSDGAAAVVARADATAAARLATLAESIGAVPGPSSGVDAATRDAMGSGEVVLGRLEARMLQELARAKRFGTRRSRTVFALSLVALAGVLAGLAAVLGAGRSGRACIALGATALVGALVWGAAALVL